jgi:hypothetical protein
MGTTLTGTTPQDTYDSLIKVTDNGPIGATAKYLSDGLGNDSILALSTARVGVGTTGPSENLHVVGNVLASDNFYIGNSNKRFTQNGDDIRFWNRTANDIEFLTNDVQRLVVKGSGNIGIGTDAPTDTFGYGRALDIQSATGAAVYLRDSDAPTTDYGFVAFDGVDDGLKINNEASGGFIRFNTGGSERARITANGLTFNGDTAAANALDDYEEGTFTATITGGTFSSTDTGRYTKIGRQVYWYLSPTTTAITGSLVISGLPFTNADRSASIFATVPPSGITYIPAFHNSSSASCDINVSGTYSGGAVSTYFAGVYSV